MTIQIQGDGLLTSLLDFTVRSVPGCLGAGLSVAGAPAEVNCDQCGAAGTDEGHATHGAPRTVAAVGVAKRLDPAQWDQAVGPLWDAFRGDATISRPATDGSQDPDDALGLSGLQGVPADDLGPVQGVVVSAGEWGGDLPVLLSLYLDRTPDDKTLRTVDRWEPMVSQALAVVEYCAGQEQVAAQMLEMTQYRRVIEQAKGLVMGAIGCDAPAAFSTIARASQHFNVRLRNLAVALVEHVGDGTVEHPPDPDLRIRPTENEKAVAQKVWAALSTSTAILPVAAP
ncbi:ANTAR domain-containing protein [Spongisporangium articulatum]|uniref:ANTAR domain-containing protein n=1 Tax=Spongisporangium articulatum TaxID=3362603 RepID=A0ABW8APS1_9ACTN